MSDEQPTQRVLSAREIAGGSCGPRCEQANTPAERCRCVCGGRNHGTDKTGSQK
jgi:hypothetical protein